MSLYDAGISVVSCCSRLLKKDMLSIEANTTLFEYGATKIEFQLSLFNGSIQYFMAKIFCIAVYFQYISPQLFFSQFWLICFQVLAVDCFLTHYCFIRCDHLFLRFLRTTNTHIKYLLVSGLEGYHLAKFSSSIFARSTWD